MKLTFAFFALLTVSGFLTVSSGPVAPASKTIRKHLRDFIDLVPANEIETLFYDYLAEDEDFAEALDYILGDEFKSHVVAIEGAAEFKDFLDFLEKLGVPAYEFVNKFNAVLQIDPISALLRTRSGRITGGMPGFLQDIKALLPVDRIKELYDDKMANAPEFAELSDKLQSDVSYDLFTKILANPAAKELIKKAETKGIDFKAILDFISSIFGFEFPKPGAVDFASESLVQHLDDFVALLPLEKFEQLFFDYLSEDEDFAITLDYLTGPDFKARFQSIEATSEFKTHLNFFEKFGLPAYETVNKLNAFLGIDLISPPLLRYLSNRITGGLPGFFKDIEALLPVDEIKKLYDQKMNEFPEFAEFVNALQSEEYFDLVGQLLDNKDVQDLVGKAESKGVDFKAILEFIGSIFGFHFPSLQFRASRSIEDDLKDFEKLFPKDKIEELFYEYLAEDEDFAEALDYVLGDVFKSQLITIESAAEFKAYIDFLEKSGLPAYETVNELNALLGIDPIKPLRRLLRNRISGGLDGFLDDFKALLPLDDIKKLYDEKVESSSEFAELVKNLESKEAYDLFEKLINVPTVVDLLDLIESKGVHINEILDILTAMFPGLKFPPRP